MEQKQLRIICFGAHPDDCELQIGGVASLWAAQGHQVKLVSVTNGDIGHWREHGPALAQRRLAEVTRAAEILGVTAQVLDIPDGELLPTLENRRRFVRLIREWKADLVFGHRPNDYHPDHRYIGVLMQDAAFMVTVPFFCPETPHLEQNPVFLYFPDRFQRPHPFQADIAISIDACIERKLQALDTLESQFYEGGSLGSAAVIPDDPVKQQERRNQVRATLARRWQDLAERCRPQLAEAYGAEAAARIQHAEAFEVCEYGRRLEKAELKLLFPFETGSR